MCPTYNTDLLEVQSPRGRVQLMRQVEEGLLEPSPRTSWRTCITASIAARARRVPHGGEDRGAGAAGAGAGGAQEEAASCEEDRAQLALGDQRRLEWLMLPVALYQRLGLQWLVRKRIFHRVLPEKWKVIALWRSFSPSGYRCAR